MLAWKQPSSKECAKSSLKAYGGRSYSRVVAKDCKGNINNMNLAPSNQVASMRDYEPIFGNG